MNFIQYIIEGKNSYMIKTVLFDIDNTVYSYDKAHKKAIEQVYLYCQEKFQWEKSLTRTLLYEAQQEEKQVLSSDCAALHNRLIRYQLMLEKQGKNLFPHVQNLYHAYWDTLLKVMKPEPGVLQLFQWIKRQNLKIGIATDMTAYMQYEKLKKLNLLSYINFIVSSEEVGVEKPNKRLFYRCAQKAACEPCECLMIGDSLEKDVKGAMAVGMRVLWYQSEENKDNAVKEKKKTYTLSQEVSPFEEYKIRNTGEATKENLKKHTIEKCSHEEIEILTSFWDLEKIKIL